MNRETLDAIVKASLLAQANALLIEIGRECIFQDDDSAKWSAGRIQERERAQKLLFDDAARGEIVDAILKEMAP